MSGCRCRWCPWCLPPYIMIEFDSAIDYCEVEHMWKRSHHDARCKFIFHTISRTKIHLSIIVAPPPPSSSIYLYYKCTLTKFRCSREVSKRGENPIFELFSSRQICSPVFGVLAQISFFEDSRDWALRLRPLCTVPGECRLCGHQGALLSNRRR